MTTTKNAAIRCALYTRKSSEEGLGQEFNSLDAQREAAEAYVASQKAEGWVALPDRYDDGGYSGGNMERPGLKQLMTDIEAGKIDCVVVYKVDRLSRSLMDFARIMETFDRHKVSFVSVTQHFNTTHSMGRLTLNVLLSFAQFEREIIGERIRDKVAASRARGKWTGGTPILGYDVDRSTASPRLVVNAKEAAQVREIFALYLERGTLLAVVGELEKRDWRCKAWKTRKGVERGGYAFDKCRLHSLLTNVIYSGKVTHKDKVYAGEHEAIIDAGLFQKVQAQLKDNRNFGNPANRNRHGALLRKLLYCKACGCAMVHTFCNRGTTRYRYYTCLNAIKKGRRKCPVGSLPAAEMDRAVVEQIACIGKDPAVLTETLKQARSQAESAIERVTAERASLQRTLARCHAALRDLAKADGNVGDRIADLHEQIAGAARRLAEIEAQIAESKRDMVTDADVAAALADFENVWKALRPRGQVQLVNLLVSRVEFDAADSTMEVTFHPAGIKGLAQQPTPEVEPEAVEPKPRRRATRQLAGAAA
ncbi:MAG: recombinase family protein [Planctomycetes bacterium]|nr:recombinase family protein [Planctomycetota bacterium]